MFGFIVIVLIIVIVIAICRQKKVGKVESDIAGLYYHRSEINKILKDGSYRGKADLVPDDDYPDSVSIYVDHHLIGYIPKQNRKAFRKMLPYFDKVTVELEKKREDGETNYMGTVIATFPAEKYEEVMKLINEENA